MLLLEKHFIEKSREPRPFLPLSFWFSTDYLKVKSPVGSSWLPEDRSKFTLPQCSAQRLASIGSRSMLIRNILGDHQAIFLVNRTPDSH